MSVNSKMTAIADKIRTLLGTSGTMGMDAMSTNLGTAVNACDAQASLIQQIKTAIEEKGEGGSGSVGKGLVIKSGTSTSRTIIQNNTEGLQEILQMVQDLPVAGSVQQKEINFYDYDGELVYAYTIEEAQALTELPPGPTHDGLIFDGWNWPLEQVKALTYPMNVGATYRTSDGKTRLFVSLQARKSPLLGLCPNGTVTVDWGDGTDPDVLTGTSTSEVVYTPRHEYAAGGDYVISLEVDGSLGFQFDMDLYTPYLFGLDFDGYCHFNSVTDIWIGDNVAEIGTCAFYSSLSNSVLKTIIIPKSVENIGPGAISGNCNLKAVVFPTASHMCDVSLCEGLEIICLPYGITSLPVGFATECRALSFLTIPESVKSFEDGALSCTKLQEITFHDGVTSLGFEALADNIYLRSVTFPESVTELGYNTLARCWSLTEVKIPKGVTLIGGTFDGCLMLKVCDFTDHTAVPVLEGEYAFGETPPDLEIRVPAALYDEWVADTNWSMFADNIVGV